MTPFLRSIFLQALRSMRRNLFANVTTIGVIAVSVLIFSTFSLIAANLSSFLRIWEDRIEVLAYLKKGTSMGDVEKILHGLLAMEQVEFARYISPADAMAFMGEKLGGQKGLLEGIRPDTLPASFEIRLKKTYRNSTGIREIVEGLKAFPQFEEIQYGKEWVDTFSALVHALRLTQWVLGGLLVASMIIITSHALQLVLSSRREEIQVMHLVGASPAFIRVPIYVEGMIQGLLGAGVAVGVLGLLFQLVLTYITPPLRTWLPGIPIDFLPRESIAWILVGGVFFGFLGSVIASMRVLRQGA
jgi:cell division transport system permease protein